MITQLYPLLMKRGQKIRVDERDYVIARSDFWENDRMGVFHNQVIIETTTGTQICLPISRLFEVRL